MKPLLICMAIVLFVFALWPSPDTTFIGNVVCLALAGICLLFAFIRDGEKADRRGLS